MHMPLSILPLATCYCPGYGDSIKIKQQTTKGTRHLVHARMQSNVEDDTGLQYHAI